MGSSANNSHTEEVRRQGRCRAAGRLRAGHMALPGRLRARAPTRTAGVHSSWVPASIATTCQWCKWIACASSACQCCNWKARASPLPNLRGTNAWV